MNTPDRPNGDEFWEKSLEGVDLSGFRNADSLLNRVVEEDIPSGTAEQRAVYRQCRTFLMPIERFLHQQAMDCTQTSPPPGVRVSFPNRYTFTISTEGGQDLRIQIDATKNKGRWAARSFQVDEDKIEFNGQGKIKKITSRINSYSSTPRYLQLNVEDPSDLKAKDSLTGIESRVDKDGRFFLPISKRQIRDFSLLVRVSLLKLKGLIHTAQ